MGYTSLEKGNWYSDRAFDCLEMCQAHPTKRKQVFDLLLEESETDFNPSGATNLALLLEGGFITANELGARRLSKMRRSLEDSIKTTYLPAADWRGNANRLAHRRWFRRLFNVIAKAQRAR